MFRSEVVEARKQKLHGDVFLTNPVSFKIITGLIGGLVGLLLLVLFTGSYARTERVSGYLVPTKGLAKIQAGRFGTVSEIYVHEGERVRVGDPLLSVRAEQALADTSVEARSLLAIADQRQNLKNQITIEENQLASEQSRMRAEIQAVKLEIASLIYQIELQKEIILSAQAGYDDVQELLGKGFISKAESERRRQSWLSQKAQGTLREQEHKNAEARLAQLNIRMDQLPGETEARVARLKAQLIEMDTREAELQGSKTYIIKAPVSGRVSSITSNTVGQSLVPQQPVLTILPENSELVAQLYVPSRAVGFVEEGQDVRLLYAAFPYQRFGSFPATITKVTETILSPAEISAPIALQEPVYRITASLEETGLNIAGKRIELQLGMQLEANIILEKRSFIDWLLEPLKSIGGRS